MTDKPTDVMVRQSPVQLQESGLSLNAVKDRLNALHGLMKDVMVKDVDYGVIPGTGDKPTLLQPGAQKICLMFGLTPTFERAVQWHGDHLTITTDCTLTDRNNVVIARSGAICSTRETKYAYRQATRKCPECGKPAIIKGRKEFGAGWVCWDKKDGCGAKFKDNDSAITSQSGDREVNPNLPDTYNTVLKISAKRSFVGATNMGTSASHIFTQDLEDFDIRPASTREYEGPFDDREEKPKDDDSPDTIFPDQLDSHIKDMESAFERGEGPSWWEANYPDIRPRCTTEQRQRITARKNELKGAGASSGASDIPPLSEAGAEGAPKPRGRPKKSAESSESGQASIVAEGEETRSEAVLSLRRSMQKFHDEFASADGFYKDYDHIINTLSDGDQQWLHSEADALEAAT